MYKVVNIKSKQIMQTFFFVHLLIKSDYEKNNKYLNTLKHFFISL